MLPKSWFQGKSNQCQRKGDYTCRPNWVINIQTWQLPVLKCVVFFSNISNVLCYCEPPAPGTVPLHRRMCHLFFLSPPIEGPSAVNIWRGNQFGPANMLCTDPLWCSTCTSVTYSPLMDFTGPEADLLVISVGLEPWVTRTSLGVPSWRWQIVIS